MLNEILEADPEQRLPYLHGMSKSAQQKLRYALYGQVGNLFNEKVFTKTGVQPSETVKLPGVERPCPGERPDGHVSYFELETIACDDAF